jgi:hypothetical protein
VGAAPFGYKGAGFSSMRNPLRRYWMAQGNFSRIQSASPPKRQDRAVDKYFVVARARSLPDPELAFRRIGEIGPLPENEAIAMAYTLVRDDKTINVGEYWLVRDEKPQTYDSRIIIHTGAEPVCDSCWGKNSQEFEPLKRYRNQPAVLERCSLCGEGTTEAWFTWFPRKKLFS